MAVARLPAPAERAALTIFREFDANGDGRLDKDELATFITRVNPGVQLTQAQMDTVLEELFLSYAAYADAGGLRRDGLLAAYADGLGDPGADLATLGLSPDRAAARDAAADLASVAALARQASPPPSPARAAAFVAAAPPTAAAAAEPARAERRRAARAPLSPLRRVPEPVPEAPPPSTGGWSRATVRASPPPTQVEDGRAWSPPPTFDGDRGLPATPASTRRAQPVTPASLRRPRSAADPYATPMDGGGARGGAPAAVDPDACVATLLARGDADAAAGRLADAARAYGSATKLAWRAWREEEGDDNAARRPVSAAANAPPPLPLAARAALRLGNTLYGMGQPEAAEAAFAEGLASLGDGVPGEAATTAPPPPSDPTAARLLPKLRLNLGIALEAQGRLAAAAAAYAAAAAAAPASAAAHKLRGSALFALGRADAAAASLRRALDLDPTYADAHVDLGCALCALGDAPGAAAAFSAALRVDPAHVEALFNLASLRRQTGDWAGAVSGYDRVLAVDPGHWRAHLGRGVALTGARRDRDARAAFGAALALAGVRADALADEVERLRAAAAAPAPSRASLAAAMAAVSARAAALVEEGGR